MSTSLTKRVALITGGGTGIGRAIAESLAAAGAFVGIHCHRSRSEADQTLRGIQERGGKGLVLPADLADSDQAAEIVDKLVAQTGRLDILVNNAGSPIERVTLESCSF